MAGKGITLTQECKIINALAPVDIGGVAKESDYFSMADYAHATIIVTCGAVTNAATITVFESDDLAGSNETAIDFKYAQELTAGGDVLGALAWVGATTGISTGTEDGTIHVIEIDASQLTDGYGNLVVKATNAAANLISVLAILSGARYQQDEMATAIA